MLQPGKGPAKNPRRFQLMFMRVCAITLLIWLFFYSISLTDVKIQSNEYLQSWNLSVFFQKAAYKLTTVLKRPNIKRKRKLILLWTDYFSKSDWLPSTVDLHCPVTECDTTTDRFMLANSSAVILHWRNIKTDDLPHCVPSETVHCPIWLLFNKEAPPHTNQDVLQEIEGKVHWIASYRTDSDIFAPYMKVLPGKNANYSQPEYNPNRRLVCWLVSNCDTPSKREVFVTDLEDYIEVDTYGHCGSMQCPHKLISDCYRWLSSRCLFYLSLENSICKDYITEKLYYALASDMVPVVMGNRSNYRYLPPRSYVNAADFPSPKELAEYLVRVGKDRDLYLSHFWWKKDYKVTDESYRWFCELCKKLHYTNVESLKPRRDLVSWWFDQSGCTSWQNL